MFCFSNLAQADPAGPPPTISTSVFIMIPLLSISEKKTTKPSSHKNSKEIYCNAWYIPFWVVKIMIFVLSRKD